MDISEKDFEKIVLATTEAVLLRVPEVIGNLMRNHSEMIQMNKKFYADYPDFKNDRNSVQSVIHEIELSSPELTQQEILNKAVPKIRERMNTLKTLDTQTLPEKENLSLSNGEI